MNQTYSLSIINPGTRELFKRLLKKNYKFKIYLKSYIYCDFIFNYGGGFKLYTALHCIVLLKICDLLNTVAYFSLSRAKIPSMGYTDSLDVCKK